MAYQIKALPSLPCSRFCLVTREEERCVTRQKQLPGKLSFAPISPGEGGGVLQEFLGVDVPLEPWNP